MVVVTCFGYPYHVLAMLCSLCLARYDFGHGVCPKVESLGVQSFESLAVWLFAKAQHLGGESLALQRPTELPTAASSLAAFALGSEHR